MICNKERKKERRKEKLFKILNLKSEKLRNIYVEREKHTKYKQIKYIHIHTYILRTVILCNT